MKLGNKFFFIIFFFNIFNFIYADDKIVTSPLINIEKIKPSFEEINE